MTSGDQCGTSCLEHFLFFYLELIKCHYQSYYLKYILKHPSLFLGTGPIKMGQVGIKRLKMV